MLRRLLCLFVVLVFALQSFPAYAGTSLSFQTGQFSYDQVDLALGSRAPIRLLRHYQSPSTTDNTKVPNGPFGKNTHLGLWSLTAQLTSGHVRIFLPTGEETNFNLYSGSTYSNAEADDSLRGTVTLSGTKITLQLENGTSLIFNHTSTSGAQQLTQITDRFGVSINLTYTGNNLTKVENSFGQGINLSYGNTSYPAQITQASLYRNGATLSGPYLVKYTYDSSGRLQYFDNAVHNQPVNTLDSSNKITTRTANGRTIYGWNSTSNQLCTITTPRGIVQLTNTWTNNKVSKQTLPGTSTSTATDDIVSLYDYYGTGDSQNTKVTDAYNIYHYYYDAKGYLTSESEEYFNTSTSYNFDQNTGLLMSLTNARGYSTSFEYNQPYSIDYHLSKITDSNPAITTSFDFSGPYGQLKSVSDPNHNTTTFAHSYNISSTVTGLLSQISDALPSYQNFTNYNSYAQLLNSTDGVGRSTSYSYKPTSALGSQDLNEVVGPDGIHRKLDYDVLSRVKQTYRTNSSGSDTTDITNY